MLQDGGNWNSTSVSVAVARRKRLRMDARKASFAILRQIVATLDINVKQNSLDSKLCLLVYSKNVCRWMQNSVSMCIMGVWYCVGMEVWC